MASRTQLTEPVERLLARERAEVLAGLQRRHRRALDDNPEGMAIISKALGQALLLGLREQCRLEGVYTHRLQAGPDAWARWQEVRDQTPESLDWPDQLSQRAHDAVEQAGGLVESAAAELDIRSRERRDFRGTGEQCAEAGAALVRTLTRPAASERGPVPAEPATVGPLQADGTVQVAFAANQAECDLLRGLLESAGIPSTWRNVGIAAVHWAQVPGARAIYVPASLAEEAKAALAKPRTA